MIITPEQPNHFALILDGRVEEIIIVNDMIADILTNESLIIAPFDPESEKVYYGTGFVENKFVNDEDVVMEQDNEKD